MKMRITTALFAVAALALVIGPAAARADLVESWENTADGWTTSGENPTYSITGFDPVNGVTNQSYSMILTGTAAPGYGQMLDGPSLTTNATMLAVAQSVSIDVLAGTSFGYQQWQLVTNGGSLGYYAIPNNPTAAPGTYDFNESPVLGQETTLTWTLTDAERAAYAADAANSTAVQLIFQVGGGGPGTMYLDNLRTTIATDPGSYTWNKDVSSSWSTAANWVPTVIPSRPGATVTFGSAITANRTVTLDGDRTMGHLVFNKSGVSYTIAQGSSGSVIIDNSPFDLGGGNFTVPTGVPDITVTAGNHTISAPVSIVNGVTLKPASGTSLTISNTISGAGGLTMGDAGKAILTTPTSYSGDTNINAGTLQIAGLSGTGNVTVGSGGTLSGTGSINGSLSVLSGGTVEMRTLPSAVDTLSPSGLTINGGSNLGFDIGSTADSIADSGSYSFAGTGKATINLDLITGFHAGDFNLITNSSGISLSQFQLGSTIAGFNATLQLSGNNLQVHLVATAPLTAFWRGGRVAGSPSVWTANNGSTNWDTSATSNADSGLPSTPTSVVFAANAATAANMANTTLGADLTINSLEIQTANPVGIGGANTLTVNNGITVDSGAGTTTISSGVGIGLAQTWANNSANKLTISGAISGGTSAALTIGGTGRIQLTGNNTYAGGTTVSSGILEVGHNHALGVDGSAVIQNGGTIQIDPSVAPVWSLTGSKGSQTIAALAGATPTLTLQTGGVPNTYGGSIQNGAGVISVAVSGLGTQILTNANTYSGGTTINAGATLQLGDGAGNSGSIAGNVTTSGTLTFAGDGTTTPGTGDQVFAGNIGGTGGVSSTNIGTVTLNGVNSYSGATTILAGTLVAGNASALGNANLTIGPSSTLDVNGKSLTVKTLTGTSSNSGIATITNNDPGTGTATLNVTNGGAFGGAITDGPTAKTKLLVSSGTLVMSSVAPGAGSDLGVSTFSGGVTVSPGATLQIGSGQGTQGQTQSPGAPSPVLGGSGSSSGGPVNVGGGASLSTLAFQWQAGGGVGTFFLTNPINLNGNSLFLETEGNGHYTGPLSVNGTANALNIQFSNKDVSFDGPISGSGTLTARALDNTNFFAGGGHLFIASQTNTLGAVDNTGFTGTLAIDETSQLGTPSINFSGIQLVIADNAGLPNATVQFNGNYIAMADIGHTGTPQNVGYQSMTGSIAFAGTLFGSADSPAIGALSSTTGGDFQLTDGFGSPVTLTLGTNTATTASFGGVISAGITSGGGIVKIGSNKQIFTAVNTYTGTTTIKNGTLGLGVANAIAQTSQVILGDSAGPTSGTLATGGFKQDFTTSPAPATLQLNANSTVDLGLGGQPGGGVVHFNASNGANGISWGSSTLTITDWTPGIDHLVFGSDSTGLDPSQISDITFAGFGAAKITATGEIVPVAAVTPFVLGDVNGDGHFTVADIRAEMMALSNLTAYENNYGPGHLVLNTDELYAVLDQNHDGLINNTDIEAAIAALANTGGSGTGGGQLTAVPEPASFVLLSIGGGIALLARLRRRGASNV